MPQRGTRPHTWVTGPDPLRHAQYQAFLRSRAQAWFRGETWAIEFQPWLDLWAPHWDKRGRHRGSYHMTRLDDTQPWQQGNVQVVDRQAWRKKQAQARADSRKTNEPKV